MAGNQSKVRIAAVILFVFLPLCLFAAVVGGVVGWLTAAILVLGAAGATLLIRYSP